MIKLRLSSFATDAGDLSLPIETNGETVRSALLRITKDVPLDQPIEKVFSVVVAGDFVAPELWDSTSLTHDSEMLVVPNLLGGESNNFIRTALIIGAAIVAGPAAGAILGPTVLTTGYLYSATQIAIGLSIGLAAYALFPPPDVNLGLSDTANSLSDSQMYSISGQSNSVQKFGIVPKVYGTHRIYPNVVGSPYTELVVDSRGEIAQDFYAIYDFGLGPLSIRDIQIGDTPLTSFNDYQYRLVDLHAPAVPTGEWDQRETSFALYKGDNSTENVSISLEANEQDIPAVSSAFYRVVRNTALNIDSSPTEITIGLVCPRGLSSVSSSGDRGLVAIDVRCRFRQLGGDGVWRNYDDLGYVKTFESLGAAKPLPVIVLSQASELTISDLLAAGLIELASETIQTVNYTNDRVVYRTYRIPGGLSGNIFARDGIPIGSIVKLGGVTLGTVTSKTPVTTVRFDLSQPPIPLFKYAITKQTKQGVDVINLKLNQARANIFSNWATTLSTVTILTPTVEYFEVKAGVLKISGTANDPIYAQIRFTPKFPGQFEVEITRVKTVKTHTFQVFDDFSITEIRTRFDRVPIKTDKRHLFLEIKIRATNQLSGSLQSLNAVCTSVLQVYNGINWLLAPTSNPAWVFVDILTGNINKRPLTLDRLHMPSILEWEAFCAEIPTTVSPHPPYGLNRFNCSLVMDYVTTVKSLIDQVTSAAQASMNIIDGKYGVLIDKLKTVPVQVFTPRNSSGFASNRGFVKQPDAVIVKFVDPEEGWQLSELTVYADGYNANTAEEFQDVNSFGCVNAEQAFRFGRFMLAQNKLRKESIQIKVDFEHLVCTRGDYVMLVNDSMAVGGTSARVKAISGNLVTIDDAIETSVSINYGYTFRSKTGQIYTNTLTVVTAETFTLAGSTMPQVGDLIVIGEVSNVTYDCIVKSITPESDHAAILTLVEKADGIYSAESGGPLPEYDPGISALANAEFAPPGAVTSLAIIDNDWECNGSGYLYYIDIDWDVPAGSAYDIFEVLVDYGKGYDLAGSTKATELRYVVSESNLGLVHNFKVLAVSATGKKLDLGEVATVTATPLRKTTPPSNVESLSIDITGEVLQLSWPRITDCDAFEYLIRFSPSLQGTWETSIPLLRSASRSSLASTQARTGTYLIKAVDFNGNQSDDAALAITTIPNLFNLNIISTTTDFPLLPGAKDKTFDIGGNLILEESVTGIPGIQEFYPEGYYYYENILDLEDIYTVRLQSLIQAQGYSPLDTMSNWATLSSITTLYSPGTSEWDVEAQYRTTNIYSTISEWLVLEDIEFLSTGVEENWTPWRKISAITDATGRIFQFRLRLLSNNVSVSPQVYDGTIKADMPDRVESYNNLTAPETGYSVVYSPAFKGPLPSPAVQLSIDDAASGDYWAFTSKSVEGFTVRFYDRDGAPVSRIFDAQIKGWGRKNPEVI